MYELLVSYWAYISTAAVAVFIYAFFFRKTKKEYKLQVKNHEKDKVYLFVFGGAPSIGMSPSSPCLKLETYLRLANIPYEIVKGDHLGKAPKGKLPYIEYNGEAIADSEIVIKELKKKHDIDEHLSAEERAVATAFTRLTDEHLYWCLVHFRWVYPSAKPVMLETVLRGVPFPLNHLIFRFIQSQVKKQLWGHGMGRHSEEEILKFAEADLKALSDFLGNKKFMFGDQPSTLDAAVFGSLYNIMRPKFKSPLKDAMTKFSNLVDYTNFIVEKYYADKNNK